MVRRPAAGTGARDPLEPRANKAEYQRDLLCPGIQRSRAFFPPVPSTVRHLPARRAKHGSRRAAKDLMMKHGTEPLFAYKRTRNAEREAALDELARLDADQL